MEFLTQKKNLKKEKKYHTVLMHLSVNNYTLLSKQVSNQIIKKNVELHNMLKGSGQWVISQNNY